MKENDRHAAIGAAVVLAGALILGFAYMGEAHRSVNAGYNLDARFNRAEGVGVGTDVRLAGVSVGKVMQQKLDDRYGAVMTLRIASDIKLPIDSAALIYTDGLLGAKFISLQPGGDDANLKPGETFRYTQDSMNVADLLEMIIAQGKARRAGNSDAPAKP